MPPPVAHNADDSGDQEEEGGASRGTGDKGNVRRLERPVLITASVSKRPVVLGGVSCGT